MINRVPLTRGRRLALLIGVPLALIVIGWTALSEVAFAGQGSYPVRLNLPVHGHTVRFAVDSGDVTVGQAQGDRLVVTGTAHYSLVRSAVTRHFTASGVGVSSHCRFPTGVCGFNYRVGVPAAVQVYLSNSSGDVTLSGLASYVNATDGSGDVHARDLSGPVKIQAGSGDIIVTGLTSADVSASDDSGDVALTFTKVPDRVSVSDSSGDVRLVLPHGKTLYRVNATAAAGNRVVHVLTSSVSRHVINVTDGSGDVSITY